MTKVFIDLEFCEVPKKIKREQKFCKCEIIQFGAVKLDEENRIFDRFECFVKPKYAQITPFIQDLTHIETKDIANAISFEAAMDQWMDWIGEDEVELYSWSNTDRTQIRQESTCKGYDHPRLKEILSHWIDFQVEFSGILQIQQNIKLEAALNGAGIRFEGSLHSALSDAENTARLYALTQDREAFEKSAKTILDLLKPKPSLSVSLGSFFSEELLKQLEEGIDSQGQV